MSKEKSILNWEDINDKLFLRLENRGKSMEVPDERIRIPFLDLVVFIYCDWSKTHWEGVYVNRNHLILWKQDKKDVLRAALRNTFQKDNIVIPITDLLSSAFGKEIHIEEGSEKDMILAIWICISSSFACERRSKALAFKPNCPFSSTSWERNVKTMLVSSWYWSTVVLPFWL